MKTCIHIFGQEQNRKLKEKKIFDPHSLLTISPCSFVYIGENNPAGG